MAKGRGDPAFLAELDLLAISVLHAISPVLLRAPRCWIIKESLAEALHGLLVEESDARKMREALVRALSPTANVATHLERNGLEEQVEYHSKNLELEEETIARADATFGICCLLLQTC